MRSGNIFFRSPSRRAIVSFPAASCLALLLGASGRELRAETITAPLTHFTASPSQTVFPSNNLNLFKQFLFNWNPSPIGIGRIDDPSWAPGKYGAWVGFGTDGSFGLEFGLCLGGNVNFDLAFQPQLTLPDRQVTGIGLPIIVAAPQIAGSHFNTTFDGIGQAYADLILDARARVDSTLCLIGCTSALSGEFDTRDWLSYSVRCDPSIDAINPPKVGIEIASLNRGNNGIIRVLNLSTPPIGPVDFELDGEVSTGKTNKTEVSLAGKISISNPKIDTDSLNSAFCQSGIICSSGNADIFSLALDVGEFVNSLIPKPKLPKPFDKFEFELKNEFSYKGLSASYVLADLNVGPVVKLKMDHEMDWDLWVTDMYFTAPNSATPRQVRIGGIQVTNVSQLFGGVLPPGQFHLSNVGPNALPLIELINTNQVEVHVSYKVVPKFKIKVSTPVIGRIDYELLSASAGFSSGPFDFGPYGVGPALKGTKEFDVANINAYSGEKTLQTPDVSSFKFTMQAVGHASFQWLGTVSTGWDVANNWIETNSNGHAVPSSVSDVVIPSTATLAILSTNSEIAALFVKNGGDLLFQKNSTTMPSLTIDSGFVDNQGTIQLNDDSTLILDHTNAMLCGTGFLHLSPTGPTVYPRLDGYWGSGDFSFVNYNTISGGGEMYVKHGNTDTRKSTIHNLGKFSADKSIKSLEASCSATIVS